MKDDEYAAILKAMGHPVRLEILRFLLNGPSCASKTNEAVPVSQPNLSQHLKALREVGLVDCSCLGTKRCYYICRPKLVCGIMLQLDGDHERIKKTCEELARIADASS